MVLLFVLLCVGDLHREKARGSRLIVLKCKTLQQGNLTFVGSAADVSILMGCFCVVVGVCSHVGGTRG
jgi:hypothetical protein